MVHLVETVDLARHYIVDRTRVLRALDGVNLTIAKGATLGLVGESGSGKSTLGRTLVGLQTPTNGTVLFDGANVASATGATLAQLRRQRQIIFQDPSGALNPRMTLGETIVEHLRVQAWSRQRALDRMRQVFDLTGLASALITRYPHEVSGGQRQRAVIARVISTDPEFIVADEPVSALDVSTRAQIMNLLRELQRTRGLTMLFISHDLSVVAHMCKEIAVMYLGRIVERAPRESLFKAPRHPYTAALLSAIPIPDPVRERARARIILSGDPPDPAAIPSGCRFHTRCSRATDICRQIDPSLSQSGTDHVFACHNPL